MKHSEILITLRKSERLSISEVAKRAGIDRKIYTRIEKGQSPTIEQMEKILKHYGWELAVIKRFEK